QDAELAAVSGLRDALSPGADLHGLLTQLLTEVEVDECVRRCELLLGSARFPAPHGMTPAVPWPVF
ncbi:MAG TPA: phosphatidylinositol kinase, partial [Candidatus Corynebacterium avicola]|nr:phosphatidylinositol kinase [Candidatus Corynebacterium avicola]